MDTHNGSLDAFDVEHNRFPAVNTMQEDFSFLDKLQIMKDSGTGNSSNRELLLSRPKHSWSIGHSQSGRYRLGSQPHDIRYRRYRDNPSRDQNRQYNQHSTGRKPQATSLQKCKSSLLTPQVASCSPERKVNDSHDRNIQSEISRQENFRESVQRRTHWM